MVETFYLSKAGEWPMSASNKFLIFAVALLVAVIGYLAVDHLGRVPAPAPNPAATQPATPAPPAPSAPMDRP